MVWVLLTGCAVLVVVGCAGVRSEAPQKEEQGRTEATASEEARCSQTRTFWIKAWGVYTTNDVLGCPKGGLLSATARQPCCAVRKATTRYAALVVQTNSTEG